MARTADTMPIGEAVATVRDRIAASAPSRSPVPPPASAPMHSSHSSQSSPSRAAAPPADPAASAGDRFERIVALIGERHGAAATVLRTYDVVQGGEDLIELRPKQGAPAGAVYNLDDAKLKALVAEASTKLFGRSIRLAVTKTAAAAPASEAKARPSSRSDHVRKMFEGEVV
jgi:hypothetical protein